MRIVEQLVADLEALQAGWLAPSDLWLRHPIAGMSGDLEQVLCNLEHYLADGDIRERDPEYRRFQDAEFQKLINHLRAGRLQGAAAVNFVNVTHA